MAESRSSSSRSGSSGKSKSGATSGSGRRSASSSKSTSSRSSSKGSSGRKSSSSRSSGSSSSSRSSAKRRAAAKKGGQARGRQQTARKRAAETASAATQPADAPASAADSDVAGKAVGEFREALARGIVAPINFVILSRDRIEEVMNDAVNRGRMTADDAQSLVQSLVRRGARETTDVLSDLEQLLGFGRDSMESSADTARKRGEGAADRARRQVEDATSRVRSRASKTADPAVAQVDRARRAAGVGPTFPILGYDDLTAAQVQARLNDLTAPELRKVRDYEKRNANRKSVLNTISTKLG